MKSLLRWVNPHLAHVILLLLGGSAILLFLHQQFTTLNTPDPFDYAQLARNLAEGKGFTTQLITPLSWREVPQLTAHPNLWWAPLYPLMVAASFQLIGLTRPYFRRSPPWPSWGSSLTERDYAGLREVVPTVNPFLRTFRSLRPGTPTDRPSGSFPSRKPRTDTHRSITSSCPIRCGATTPPVRRSVVISSRRRRFSGSFVRLRSSVPGEPVGTFGGINDLFIGADRQAPRTVRIPFRKPEGMGYRDVDESACFVRGGRGN